MFGIVEVLSLTGSSGLLELCTCNLQLVSPSVVLKSPSVL